MKKYLFLNQSYKSSEKQVEITYRQRNLHNLLSKATLQEFLKGESKPSLPVASPLPTKSIYPTKFNVIIENLDHVKLFSVFHSHTFFY